MINKYWIVIALILMGATTVIQQFLIAMKLSIIEWLISALGR